MKFKVEYSESVQGLDGVWRKHGIIIDSEGMEADPDEMDKMAVNYVTKWHSKHEMTTHSMMEPIINSIPVTKVQSKQSRVEVLAQNIELVKTIEELNSWKLLVSKNPELQPAFDKKLSELQSL